MTLAEIALLMASVALAITWLAQSISGATVVLAAGFILVCTTLGVTSQQQLGVWRGALLGGLIGGGAFCLSAMPYCNSLPPSALPPGAVLQWLYSNIAIETTWGFTNGPSNMVAYTTYKQPSPGDFTSTMIYLQSGIFAYLGAKVGAFLVRRHQWQAAEAANATQ